MAEDVISPPSPPEPEPPLQLAPTRRDRARKSSYRLRFGIIYLALAAIVGAGVGAFVVLATRSAPPEAAAWSSWEPTGSRLARVRQIADRIPKAYKQGNGEQLTVTQASQLAVPNPSASGDTPVASIFVSPDASRGRAEEFDINTYSGADAIAYGLCGLGAGAHCAMSLGSLRRAVHATQPSGARALAVHVQVRPRRQLCGRLPAFLRRRGQSNGSVFFRPGRRRRRLSLSRLHSSARAHTAHRGNSDIELGNIARLTLPVDLRLQFNAAGRRQANL